jgi:hypothetical protein
MASSGAQQTHHLAHFAQIMVWTNSRSNLHIPCHQEDPFSAHTHRISYHQLKKEIRQRQKSDYISTVNHHFDKIPNIRFHRLNQTLCNAKKEKEYIPIGHSHVQKKNEKQVYMEQIKDTRRNKCAICEELHFQRSIKCFTHDFEK